MKRLKTQRKNNAENAPSRRIFSLVKGEKRTRSVRNANVGEGEPE